MPNKTVTIGDVADLAGVSRSTVSRVLTGSPTLVRISDETRQRVLAVARDLGYRPHPGARALSGKRTYLLGVIVREINDPFFADLVEVISSTAKDAGYDLVLGNAKRDPEQALALRDAMLDLRYCDGILLCGDLAESAQDSHFLSHAEGGQRIVSVSRGNRQLVEQMPSIGTDNQRGVCLALEHLASLGHQQIACFDAGRVGDLWERLEAYRTFMQSRFGAVPEEYVWAADNSYAGGYRAGRELLTLPLPPTAIFAVDDVMATGALCAAIDLGLRVPDFVSIVGFDDGQVSAYVRPALTTVRQSVQEMGEQAVRLVLDMIEEREPTGGSWSVCLEPVLVVRASTAAPRS